MINAQFLRRKLYKLNPLTSGLSQQFYFIFTIVLVKKQRKTKFDVIKEKT